MREQSRDRVLEALRRHRQPVTARELSAELGLHVTTVRYHLDALAANASAVRVPAAASGERGRPELHYAVVDAERAREELLALLANLVDRGAGREAAQEAGEAWADAVPVVGTGAPLVVAAELARRGFAPEPTSAGMDLHGCPFRDAATSAPGVVCAIHLGLTRRLVERADGEGTWDVTLEPFVTDSLCRVGLTLAKGAT